MNYVFTCFELKVKSEDNTVRPEQFVVVAVIVVYVYTPVTGQRQTLTYWTIRTLFIEVTTS